ncbi:hypothetical protein LEAN103870_15775 [Legionella anisa]|uniref:Uncharacterized protein n=1 Tax=Legionella anisa TaxID=28082 RepID=A0AAX0WXJ9_9GAMM|nr:hypothetical protein [Legionella anisa]AWN72512.1 hypothetical protein DLD14_00860 [Legionella anisa]KTC74725.1 hypothetical protein Lani_0716 [Legionella anisa]MBN5937636.1 hypothetical protein [Legionella anisa]MCW8423281.1 hypothetical protein [Legionella anisa]MCW8446800.1 hypothetical protein [Legionella anisa]
MFFKVQPQELNRVVRNLDVQRELLERQLKDGSISKEEWQKEQKRLASLISSYTENIISAVNEQKSDYSPR